jgi:hypothetical protein
MPLVKIVLAEARFPQVKPSRSRFEEAEGHSSALEIHARSPYRAHLLLPP